MQELQEQSPKLSQFLAKMKPYFIGEPKVVSGEKVWNLKQTIFADGPVALNAIQVEASSLGITFSKLPTPKFSLKESLGNGAETGRLYLHVADIEGGGPQPRTKITPDDPETVALYKSIESKGQIDPISVYPSPNTPGKYRVFDGHRRTMVVFTMLMKPEIKADCLNITEQEAFENAFVVHQRQNLSAYDQGHYILEELMKRFPAKYPNQEAVAKNLGLTQQAVSLFVRAYLEVEAQKPHLPPEVTTRVVNLPERTITHVSKLSESLKADALVAIIDNKLSVRETEELIDNIRTDPDPSPEKVVVEAQRIADAKAERYFKEADKEVAKTERARDKVVAASEELPEELMTAVFGHLGLKGNGKVTPEKAKSFALTVVAVLFQKCLDRDELDDVLREADIWQ
jgi:ParB/RepB/Spo0J family partition protein